MLYASRDKPDFVRYFQVLTDLIAIFWQFHLQEIEEGRRSFSSMVNTEKFIKDDVRESPLIQKYWFTVSQN